MCTNRLLPIVTVRILFDLHILITVHREIPSNKHTCSKLKTSRAWMERIEAVISPFIISLFWSNFSCLLFSLYALWAHLCEQYKVVLFLATKASWQKTQILGYKCLLSVIVISPLWCSMVQHGAGWCKFFSYVLKLLLTCCSKYLAYRWATKWVQNAQNDENWQLV